MGLDMYLSKRTYVKNWNYHGPEKKHTFTAKKGGKKIKHIQTKRITNIVEEVAYWRKANHIHQWFVQNVQGGVDECQLANVSIEKLQELRGICQTIVDYFDKSVSDIKKYKPTFGYDFTETQYDIDVNVLSDLLPTANGFFFGGTKYDHWYYQDCKDTVRMIDEALKGVEEEKENWSIDFQYQSSW